MLARFWSRLVETASNKTMAHPVSRGFGRRLRYLAWGNHNGKLIELTVIGDPVFTVKFAQPEMQYQTLRIE